MERLIINPGTAEAWEWPLTTGRCSVGRSEANDLVLDHPSVSSSHCEIEAAKGGIRLRDTGSTSGTFVDGQLVEDCRLRSGQVFRVGEVSVQYEGEPSPTRVPEVRGRLQGRPAVLGTGQPQEPVSFYRALPQAFAYPLSANGLILIAAGGVVFLVFGWLPLVGFLLTGYLFNYAKKIVAATAAGDADVPDWPDLTNWAEDLLLPYVQLAGLTILTFGPALLLGVFLPDDVPLRRWWVMLAMAYGAFLAPMGMLALAMFDTLSSLNPLALMWSIIRIPAEYVVAAVAFGVVITAHGFSEELLGVIPVPFLPRIVAGFLNLYLIIVAMRILGLLYRAKWEELGWFSRN